MSGNQDAIAGAVQRAGVILADGYQDAYCPNGTGEEQERLAARLEHLRHEAAEHTPPVSAAPDAA